MFDVFEENVSLCDKTKFTLAGDNDWSFFKIYSFTKLNIDLVGGLNKLNSLLVKHKLYNYGELFVSIDPLALAWALAFLSKKNTKNEIENAATTFNFTFGEQLMKTEVWSGLYLKTKFLFFTILMTKILTFKKLLICWIDSEMVIIWTNAAGNCLLRCRCQTLSRGTATILKELNLLLKNDFFSV